MQPKVSVIVPIYNVRDYLARCVESLMMQTLDDVEYVFVEDCSTDDSYDVLIDTLSRFPERQKDVRIIRHDVNKGLARSRADGLDVATGDYIIHCDSDDWTDVTMLEKMHSKAIEDKADICFCEFYFACSDKYYRMHPKVDCSKNHEGVVRDYLVWVMNTIWDLLVSRDVYERSGARPPEGIVFTEDFYLSVRLFQYARKVTSVNEPLYFYNRMNTGSITMSMAEYQMANELDCYERTIAWFKERGVYEHYHKQMQWRLVKAKAQLVFLNRFDEFRNLHPESHRYILTAPFTYYNLKARIMMLLAVLRLDALCRWDNNRHGRR